MKPRECAILVGIVVVLGCNDRKPPLVSHGDGAPEKTESANLPDPVTDGRGNHDTPQLVFAEYLRATKAGESTKVYDCLTPAARDAEVAEFQFQLMALGSNIPTRHEDADRVTALETTDMAGLTESQRRAVLVGLIRDKRAFFVEAAAHLAEDFRRTQSEGPLREIAVAGSRARGIVTRQVFFQAGEGPLAGDPVDAPIYFSKSDAGWRIDLPSPEEQVEDFERAEALPVGTE
jgi:hypothetical protein